MHLQRFINRKNRIQIHLEQPKHLKRSQISVINVTMQHYKFTAVNLNRTTTHTRTHIHTHTTLHPACVFTERTARGIKTDPAHKLRCHACMPELFFPRGIYTSRPTFAGTNNTLLNPQPPTIYPSYVP